MHRPDPRGAHVRPKAVLRAALLGLGLGSLAPIGACAPTQGYVEIAWALIDEGGNTLYPDGEFPNTCDFTGLFKPEPAGEGEDEGVTQEVSAILRVELVICDPNCDGGCDDPTCQIVDPTSFACNTARAQITVPSSEDHYRFETHLIAEIDGKQDCICQLTTACALLPGPRERRVRAGLVTDLQVYQVVLALDQPKSATIDLTECCELPPSCT